MSFQRNKEIKNNKILAIIPARGGSKRIPGKNTKLLAGKPLISYTIEAALDSQYLDKVVVSTDDEGIAQVARRWRAEVIKRPKQLAADSSRTIEAVFHVLTSLGRENYIPEVLVLLPPTSPLRVTKDIDTAIELFLNKDCESLISVCSLKRTPYWVYKIEKGYLKFLMDLASCGEGGDLSKIYISNGAISINTTEALYKYNEFLAKKTIPYIMPYERSIDIDEEVDFKFAELLLKHD